MNKKITAFAIVIIVILIIIFLSFFFLRLDKTVGYFSPIFSNDGREVFFVERDTLGFTKTDKCDLFGFGGCFVKALILKDNIYLKKINLQTKEMVTVKEFPPSPLRFKMATRRGGSAFGMLSSSILFDKQNNFQYSLQLPNDSDMENDNFENLCISKIFDNVQNKFVENETWREARNCTYLGEQSSLYNDKELIALRGVGMYPSAIAKINHDSKSVEVLIKNKKSISNYYPDGVNYNNVISLSNKNRLENEKKVNKTYDELLQGYKKAGLDETDAILKTHDEMEKLGYFPASPTITANVLSDSELNNLKTQDQLTSFFEISEAEMESGIFTDIEMAIKNPGVPAEKSYGQYISHKDFKNSKLINEFLDAGEKIFYIKLRDVYYKIIISD